MLAIKNRGTALALGMLMLPLMIWVCYSGFADLVRTRDARDVATQIGAARAAIEKMPPGVGRIEEFVRRLRAVDPGYAPPQVKQALGEYTEAMAQSLARLQQRQDTTVADRVCAEKAKQLEHAIDEVH
jgi:hypothetical protein